MPVTLSGSNRFKTVRAVATLANDATPPAPTFSDDQRINGIDGEYIAFYWTGTTPTGILDVTLWLFDGLLGQFVEGPKVTGLAPNTLATLQAYNASNAALLLSNTVGAGGTDIVVRAFTYFQ